MNRVEFGQVIGRELVRRIRVMAPSMIGQESPQYKDGFDSLRESMEESGCSFLGSGNFSSAWHHPELGSKVVKLCAHATTDCGAIYLAWARRNAGRKHIPRVHHLEVLHGGMVYFAILDKMEKMEWDSPQRAMYDEWSRNGWKGSSYNYSTDAHKEFARTVEDIFDFHRGWCGTDLHDENVMVNPDGELVITDPLSYFKGTDEQRSNVLSTYQGANA